jgi:hypothetical protein
VNARSAGSERQIDIFKLYGRFTQKFTPRVAVVDILIPAAPLRPDMGFVA